MAQVTLPYTLTPGTPENVNNLMSNLTALRNGVNTIDTAQIANGAITSVKLASGVAGTPDNGSVTDAKLAAALADDLAIDNGGSTRRASVTATTERTTTSGSFVDVTGASLTLTVPTNSAIIVGVACEAKNSSSFADTCNVRVLVGSATLSANESEGMLYADTNAYSPLAGAAVTHSALSGTGTQTVKAQFKRGAGGTAYVKNLYLTAFALTY